MSRKVKLERIIIGSLLESVEGRNFFDDCCLISQDMFSDGLCHRLFGYIRDMNRKGIHDTRPSSVFTEYGAEVVDIVADMVGLCNDYSFIHLKTHYNERNYLAGVITGKDFGRTEVEFIDYVKQFVLTAYEGKQGNIGAEGAAA